MVWSNAFNDANECECQPTHKTPKNKNENLPLYSIYSHSCDDQFRLYEIFMPVYYFHEYDNNRNIY